MQGNQSQTQPMPKIQMPKISPIIAKKILAGEGRKNKTVNDETVDKIWSVLQSYRDSKTNLDSRVTEDENWWKLRHYEHLQKEPYNGASPSAWLFNSIINKHADAMDNIPEAMMLPNEVSDQEAAKILTSLSRTILEGCDYETVYSDLWYDLLVHGTAIQIVFWDRRKARGIGDVNVKRVDIHDIFWESGIEDIQDSRNVFHVEQVDSATLLEEYPEAKDHIDTGEDITTKYDSEDYIDRSKKVQVVDWYYKKNVNQRTVVHYCKFIKGFVLYASENDKALEATGYFEHGQYPFVIQPLFKVKNSPAGFGFVDIMKGTQEQIDKLSSLFIDSAKWGMATRYFATESSGVNNDDFMDVSKRIVKVHGSMPTSESLMKIDAPAPDSIYMNVYNNLITELKETSGNRDFQQGGTANGVTSASGISALIESGAKPSRDANRGAYRAFKKVNEMIVGLILQFYTVERSYRITQPNGSYGFETVNIRNLIGDRDPIFDIKVKAYQKSPFSAQAQNERAAQLFQMGMFRPDLYDQAAPTLKMMEFEGKEEVIQEMNRNYSLDMQVKSLQDQCVKLATIVDELKGSNIAQNMVAAFGGTQSAEPNNLGGSNGQTATLAQKQAGDNQFAKKIVEKVAGASNV